MNASAQGLVAVCGRFLLSVIFILSGVMKMLDWQVTAEHMAAKDLPTVNLLLTLAIAVEILGGLALLLGWQARAAATLLFLFMIPATFTFHDFWSYQGQEMQQQMIHFLKNLALMGGLLQVCAFGAGNLSLDAHAHRWTRPAWWQRRRHAVH